MHGEHAMPHIQSAKYFHKAHRNVVRSIDRLLEALPVDAFNVLNFERVEYKDKKGETRLMFLLNHDAFAILAMGFTGREALVWKIKFLQAFNAMESELHVRTRRFAAALDQVRPALRPVVEGTQGGLNRAAIAAPLGKSCAAVTYHRSQARRLGLLSA
jgi:Rha family phage regulatory protein